MSHPFHPNLQKTINPKPLELATWHFDTMLPPFMCHVSRVKFFWNNDFIKKKYFWNWWSLLVEGLLSKGPTPSFFSYPLVFEMVRKGDFWLSRRRLPFLSFLAFLIKFFVVGIFAVFFFLICLMILWHQQYYLNTSIVSMSPM